MSAKTHKPGKVQAAALEALAEQPAEYISERRHVKSAGFYCIEVRWKWRTADDATKWKDSTFRSLVRNGWVEYTGYPTSGAEITKAGREALARVSL